MLDRSLLRGAGIFLAWLVGPLGLFIALARAGVLAAVGPLILLFPLIYPHDSFYRRATPPEAPVLSPNTAVIVAIAQWAVVTIVFAVVTRRFAASRQAWLAPVVVVGVGVGVLLLTSLLGIPVAIDAP